MKHRTPEVAALRWTLAAVAMSVTFAGPAAAQANLSDVEMAHVAVTASQIDIAQAHLALALSENEAVRTFAQTMIRDHEAVNGQVAALAKKLNVTAKDNDVSRSLVAESKRLKDELSRLRGAAFDRKYAEAELAYHKKVNGVVEDAFIPNADNAEIKSAFQQALTVFRGHERHAQELVSKVGAGGK